MSRISSCGSAMISFRSGTSENFSCAAGAIGSLVAGVAGTCEVLGRDLVAQQRGVALERLVHLGVGHAHPPGEERVVAVVEVEPLGRDRPQLLDRGRAERRLLAIDARRRRGQPRDLLRDVGDRRRRRAARSCPRRGCALRPAARASARTAPPPAPAPSSAPRRRAVSRLAAIVGLERCRDRSSPPA